MLIKVKILFEVVDCALRHAHHPSEIPLGHFPDENVKVGQSDLVEGGGDIGAHTFNNYYLLVIITGLASSA